MTALLFFFNIPLDEYLNFYMGSFLFYSSIHPYRHHDTNQQQVTNKTFI